MDDDPYIIQVGVTSTPAQEETYTLGETTELTAKFSIDVEVDGNPGLGMWVGDNWSRLVLQLQIVFRGIGQP